MIRTIVAAVGALFLLAGFLPAHAAPTKAQVTAACAPGTDPQKAGDEAYPGGLSPTYSALTPQILPGAITISAAEAKCMIDRYGAQILVIAAMGDEDKLPGAKSITGFANPASSQADFAQTLAGLAGGDKQMPMVIYCHHESCFLSYNLALRAVQAGYQQVYWLRPGILGWQEAGYALAPRPPRPGEVELSPRYVDENTRCRSSYLKYTPEDWAGMVHQIPGDLEQAKTFATQREEGFYWYNMCLENVSRDSVAGAADRAEAAKRLAGARAEIDALYAAARTEVDANPAKYLSMTWDSHRPDALRADLAAMRRIKTLAEACGTFDLSQPWVSADNNAYLTSQSTRRLEWSRCLETYRDDSGAYGHTFGLSSANKWVDATRRWTCRQNPKPNCIPNEPFDAIAAVATAENVRFVEQQEDLYASESGKVNDLIRAGNEWIDELNRRIGEYNANQY